MPHPTPPRTFAGLTLEELEKLHRVWVEAGSDSVGLPTDGAVLALITAYRAALEEIEQLKARLELVRAGKGGG